MDFIDITLPVGAGSKAKGGNDPIDVKRIQERLNEMMPPDLERIPRPYGTMNRQTEQAIRSFQAIVVGMRHPDGVIDPVQKTLIALNDPASRNRWHRMNLAEPAPREPESPKQTSVTWFTDPKGSVKGKDFDSVFTRNARKATLQLELHLLLEKVPGGVVFDADGKFFATEDWNTHDWIAYRTKLAKEASTHWSGRFWLVPPKSAIPLAYVNNLGESWIVPVECRLAVRMTTTRGHRKVRVAHLGRPGSRTAQANQLLRTSHKSGFRAHDRLYDQDLGSTTHHGAGTKTTQRTHLHEVGHAIGQPHIGQMTASATNAVACLVAAMKDPSQGTNSAICYGVTAAERSNTMGTGEGLTTVNARPWQERIGKHVLGAFGDWQVKMTAQKRQRMR
jgi:hypothetical protein